MKKNYISPSLSVITMQASQSMLVGSVRQDTTVDKGESNLTFVRRRLWADDEKTKKRAPCQRNCLAGGSLCDEGCGWSERGCWASSVAAWQP